MRIHYVTCKVNAKFSCSVGQRMSSSWRHNITPNKMFIFRTQCLLESSLNHSHFMQSKVSLLSWEESTTETYSEPDQSSLFMQIYLLNVCSYSGIDALVSQIFISKFCMNISSLQPMLRAPSQCIKYVLPGKFGWKQSVIICNFVSMGSWVFISVNQKKSLELVNTFWSVINVLLTQISAVDITSVPKLIGLDFLKTCAIVRLKDRCIESVEPYCQRGVGYTN
jgi:hypothetical protein